MDLAARRAVVFVLAWFLGPSELRDAVPILVVFVIALGLEIQFLVARSEILPGPAPDRSPQQIDRDRYGFPPDEEELEDEWVEPRPVPAGPLCGRSCCDRCPRCRGLDSRRLDGLELRVGERRAETVECFSDEASVIAEKPVSIRCDEARDYVGAVQHADGVATLGGDLAILTPEICHDLYRLAFDGEVTGAARPRDRRARARVMAPPRYRRRGDDRVLRTAERRCARSAPWPRRGQGRAPMRQQLTENALRGAESIEYRVTSDCRDGGRLDPEPEDSGFP